MWQLLMLHELITTDDDAREAALLAAVLLAVEMHQPQVVAEQLNTSRPNPTSGVITEMISGEVAVPLTPGINVFMSADTAVMYACVYALNRGSFYAHVTELFTSDDPQDDIAALFAVELARAFNGLGRFATAKETLAPVIRRTRFDRLIRCAALEQRSLANIGLAERAAAKRDVVRMADLSPQYPTLAVLERLVG